MSNSSKRGFLSTAGAMGLLALLVACTSDSYLVVTMVAPQGMKIDNVAFIQVTATNTNGRMTPLLQFQTPRSSGGAPEVVSLDDTKGKDFSLQFDHGERGPVKLVVSAFSPTCGCLAEGKVDQVPLNRGGTRNESLTMFPASTCTNTCFLSGGATGGAAGGATGTGGAGGRGGQVGSVGGRGGTATGGVLGTGGGMTFPGCDPASTTSCGAGQTCFVNCTTHQGMCVTAGAGKSGSTCNGNEDCAAGTQCFDYSGLGCTNVRVCLPFCGSDGQCTSAVGAGSLCVDPVVCDVPTSYKTCSSACDPRGQATQGCTAGLKCFLFSNPRGGEDVADCSCAGTRPKREGDACVTSNDCVAGTVCHATGGTQVCRPVCKPTETDCSGGKTCKMVMNSSVYGVCL